MSNPRKWLQRFDVFPSRANGFASGTSTDMSIFRNSYPKLDRLSTILVNWHTIDLAEVIPKPQLWLGRLERFIQNTNS